MISRGKILQIPPLTFNITKFLIEFIIFLDNRFYEFDLKVLSAACVAFLRKVNGLPEWCKQLSIISNY